MIEADAAISGLTQRCRDCLCLGMPLMSIAKAAASIRR